MKAKTAFTLIELLVVVAIVAMLAALLLPAIDSARDRAVTANCLSNMRQQAVGMLMYGGDWDGAFKSVSDAAYADFFTVMNASYVGNTKIWRCPALPSVYSPANNCCVVLNNLLDAANFPICGVTIIQGVTAVRQSMLPHPSTTAMYFERINLAAPSFDQGWAPNENNQGFNGPPTMNPTAGLDGGPWPFHTKVSIQSATLGAGGPWPGGSVVYWDLRDTNVARVDGSVRTYPWVNIVNWNTPAGTFWTQPTGASYTAGCFGCPRAYLYSGYGPPTNGATKGASGWLAE